MHHAVTADDRDDRVVERPGLARHHNDLFVTRVGEGSNRALMTFAVRPLLPDMKELQ